MSEVPVETANKPVESAVTTRGRTSARAPSPVLNVVSNWGAFAFSAVLSFLLSPFIVHTLGDTAYGTWALAGAMIGYLGLLDLGVRGAVTRYVAQMHAASRHGDAGRIASAALNLFGGGGLIAVVIALVLSVLVGDLFHIPPELVTAARVVLVLGGINVGVSLIGGVYGGVLAALQRFDLSSGIDVLVEALRVVAVVVTLKLGGGLIGLSVVQLGATTARALIQVGVARRLYPAMRVRLRGWGRAELTQIFSFSVYSIFLHVAGMISLQTSSVVIGAVLPVAMITGYAIAANLMAYARMLGSGVAQTLTPQASALEARGGQEAVRSLPLIAGRLTSVVMLPMVVTFLVRGGTFIALWMGPEYVSTAQPVLIILSISLWVSAPRYALSSIMMGIGRHRVLVLPYFAEALVNLGLSIVLIRSMGIVGVAWGTTVPNVIVTLLVMPWLLRRVLNVPVRELCLHAWIRPAVAMVPFVAVSYAIETFWPAGNLFMYFAQVAAAMPAAMIGSWFVGLTRDERRRYGARIRERLRARTVVVERQV